MKYKKFRQDVISNFLFNIWLYSEDKELDKYLWYMARKNKDNDLVELVKGGKSN